MAGIKAVVVVVAFLLAAALPHHEGGGGGCHRSSFFVGGFSSSSSSSATRLSFRAPSSSLGLASSSSSSRNNNNSSSRGGGGGARTLNASSKSYDKPTRRPRRRREEDDGPTRSIRPDDDDEDRRRQRDRLTSSVGCPHFGTCPGCVRDDNVSDIDVVESARLYFSSRSVQKHIIVDDDDYGDDHDDFYKIRVPSPITRWRTQAKLAVAPASTWTRDAGCKVGLYQRRSHDVLSIPDCRVHHPSINRAVDVLVEATKRVRTPAYQEDIGQGLLRYVQFQVEISTGKVCLSLVMNAEKFKETQPHLSRLAKELRRSDPDIWHSIWVHCNDSRGNAIFSRDATRWHPVDGPPYVRENIPGSSDDPEEREGLLYFSPRVFRQGNLEGFGDIAREVREAIPARSKVCELYAGVGLLGLSAMLHHGKLAMKEESEEDGVVGGGVVSGGLGWLRCSDENPENARCFERAADSMPMRITGRTPHRFQKGGAGGKKKKKGRGRKGGGRGGRSDNGGEMSIKDLMDSMMSEGEGGGNGGKRGNRGTPDTDTSERVTYMQASAASALHRGQALGADVIIVDPPRRGLDDAVLEQLCKKRESDQPYAESPGGVSHLPSYAVNWTNDARTLIYVSCGFDALARDLDRLLSASGAGWGLESATGYVLFPGSNHVETVVVLRR